MPFSWKLVAVHGLRIRKRSWRNAFNEGEACEHYVIIESGRAESAWKTLASNPNALFGTLRSVERVQASTRGIRTSSMISSIFLTSWNEVLSAVRKASISSSRWSSSEPLMSLNSRTGAANSNNTGLTVSNSAVWDSGRFSSRWMKSTGVISSSRSVRRRLGE